MKFIANVWAAFLARVKPVSTIAKPACMNITRKPVTSVHTKLMATVFAAAATLAALASESVAAGACATRASGHTSPGRTASRAERFMTTPEVGVGKRGVTGIVHKLHDKVNSMHQIALIVQIVTSNLHSLRLQGTIRQFRRPVRSSAEATLCPTLLSMPWPR